MPTPTKKPVDIVTVSLSDADFKRIVGDSMDEVLNREYGGRVEVIEVTEGLSTGSPPRWTVECVFIPEKLT